MTTEEAYFQYLRNVQNPDGQGPYYDPENHYLYTSLPEEPYVEASIPLSVAWGATGYGDGQYHQGQGQPSQGPPYQGQPSYSQTNHGQQYYGQNYPSQQGGPQGQPYQGQPLASSGPSFTYLGQPSGNPG